jgi:hypothetical protein
VPQVPGNLSSRSVGFDPQLAKMFERFNARPAVRPRADIMAGSPPGQFSRWDRGDHEAAIHALDGALTRAGLPGELQSALKVLARVEELVAAGRRERDKAQAKLEAATRVLLADEGEIDVAAYGAVLNECAPWISDDASGSIGVGDAGRQVRMRATMIVFGMASGIYRKLTDHCRDVVTLIAGVPDPPPEVWQASSFAEASTVMIRHGREADWASFVRLSEKWSNIHAAAALLRETGQFETQLHFDGAPVGLGLVYLNWQAAVGPEQMKQLPGPLRVRKAHDLGWVPGCWLKSDHDAFAAEQLSAPFGRWLAICRRGLGATAPGRPLPFVSG